MAIDGNGLLRKVLVWTAASACTSLALAETMQRYPLTPQTVADALAQRGAIVAAGQISMPMHVTSTETAPELKIVHSDRVFDGGVRLQIRCARLGECVSFVAVVHVPEQEGLILLHLSSDSAEASTQMPEPSTGPGFVPPGPRLDAEPIVHPGQPIVLWMEDGHLRIHIPVIVLEPGRRGQAIRVATADRKTIFQAVVLDGGNGRGVKE